MIKLAEMTTKARDEPLPGNLITLNTPIVETPAIMTPKIKLSLAGSTPGGMVREVDYGFPEIAVPNIKLKLGQPTPKKKVSKSQSSGLSDEDRLLITRALDKLVSGV